MERNSQHHSTAVLLDADGYMVAFIEVRMDLDTKDLYCPTRPELFVDGVAQDPYSVVYDAIPPSTSEFCKPQWDGEQWVEKASKKELAAWEDEKAALAAEQNPHVAPDRVDQLAIEVSQMMAEIQMQNDIAMAELTLAMMGGVAGV